MKSEGQITDYFREMAMREKLIVGAIVFLLVSWFALDAVAEIISFEVSLTAPLGVH